LLCDASVVHENVEPTELAQRLLDHRVRSHLLADVARSDGGARTSARDQRNGLPARFLIDVGDHHRGALECEQESCRPSEAGPRSRDDRYLAVEPIRHVAFL
jgi:hypothetical protein